MKTSRESFSRMSDFALLLIPNTLGVAHMVWGKEHGLFVYSLYLIGVGSALALLKGLEQLEASEGNVSSVKVESVRKVS